MTEIDLSDPINQTRLDAELQVWKQIVEVQMHFNDISIRIRSFLITILLAIFGAAGFVLHQGIMLVHIFNLSISPLPFLFLAGYLAIFLLYFMDRYWYHQLLKGSVDAAIPLSNKYKDLVVGIDLGEQITNASSLRINDHWWLKTLKRFKILTQISDTQGEQLVSSNAKLEVFYKSALAVMIGCVLLSAIGGVYVDGTWWPLSLL